MRKSFLYLLLSSNILFSAPVSKEIAMLAVKGWIKTSDQSFGRKATQVVKDAVSYKNESGAILFHQVRFKADGFVITSADDTLEPIVAFSNISLEQIKADDPLYTLLQKDALARKHAASHKSTRSASNASINKWTELIGQGQSTSLFTRNKEAAISDVWIQPLLESQWGQSTVNGQNCYNYYTPNTSVCGCVATAMAQVMYYHKFPIEGIGRESKRVSFNDVDRTLITRGGDGNGGSYKWDQMPSVPGNSTTMMQRQAIGSLCYDAGLSVNMMYTLFSSGAYMLDVEPAFENTFNYSNASSFYDYNNTMVGTILNLICSNLDAKLPVILGISDAQGQSGHAIVCDGYGYNGATMYHHLNMGWDGYDDLWYNLPIIDVESVEFSIIDSITYNIYKTGQGQIVSGRVVDEYGQAVSTATVTATLANNDSFSTTTNTNGVYAFAKLSEETYSISASQGTYSSSVITRTIIKDENIWQANIVLSTTPKYDLAPFKPNGWGDKIILSTTQNTNSDASLFYTDSTIYLDIAVANLGVDPIEGCDVKIYLDDALIDKLDIGQLAGGRYIFAEDLENSEFENLALGYHTLKIIVDEDHKIAETDESNNEYIKTFYISPYAIEGAITNISHDSFEGAIPKQITVSFRSYKLGPDKNCFIECASVPEGWSVTPKSRNLTITDNGTLQSRTFTITPPAFGGTGRITWKFYDDGFGIHPSGSTLLDTKVQAVSATNSLPERPVLTAEIGAINGSIKLTWPIVSKASEYFIYYSESDSTPPMTPINNGFPASGSSVGATTSKFINNLTAGQSYYISVRAKNASGWGAYSEVKSVFAKITPPRSPSYLIASKGSQDGEVTVRWNKSSTATSYTIHYGEAVDGPPYASSLTGTPNNGENVGDVSLVTIGNLTPLQTYYFSITAINAGGVSKYTTPKAWQVSPETPTISTGVIGDKTDHSTTLSAEVIDLKSGVSINRGIEVSVDGSNWALENRYPELSTLQHFSIPINGLLRGTQYYYRAFVSTDDLHGGLVHGFGAVKSFITDFTFDPSTLDNTASLKSELQEAGVVGLDDQNLDRYQIELQKYKAYLGHDIGFVQNLVSTINEGNEFQVLTINTGWNLISCPIEAFDLKQCFVHNRINFTAYHYQNQTYQYCGTPDSDHYSLIPGSGYWVFSLKKIAAVISLEAANITQHSLASGWNLVGPYIATSFDNLREIHTNLNGLCWGWDTETQCYKNSNNIEIGQGYWLRNE